jgi:hypothetical protein
LDTQCHIVQFGTPLTAMDFKVLANFLLDYPDVTLRMYGHYFTDVENLDFLQYFPKVQHFGIDVVKIKTFDGIDSIASNARSLALGPTKRSQTLSFLLKFQNLRELYIDGHQREINVIGDLKNLEKLTIRSITLENLDFLRKNQTLWWFALKLGGTKNLNALIDLPNLKYLEIFKVRDLSNLDTIGELSTLQFLVLDELKQVTKLPSFDHLLSLRRLQLDTMNGLTDISFVATAIALEELIVLATSQITPDQFLILQNHPSLKKTFICLGSEKRNKEVERLLPLERMTVAETIFKSEFVFK